MPSSRRIHDRVETLVFPQGDVACRLRLSARRRTLALRVNAVGEVVVNAPLRVPLATIHGFVGKHLEWIRSRQTATPPATQFVDGMALPYLGRELLLQVCPPQILPFKGRLSLQAMVQRDGDVLQCYAAPEAVEAAVLNWYHRSAQTVFAARLAVYANPLPALRISNARTRWGSLSPRGVVSLNWRLLKASEAEIDYVICHELAHFKQRNHSPAFWREVEALFPAWASVRRTLREQGHIYFQF